MSDTASHTAIVGMAAVFPGAPDLDRYWRNIEAGVDAIADVPPGRIDPAFFDGPDSLAARRGGFIDDHALFDPATFGIMPVAAAGAEPDQLLALQVAARALADAGLDGGVPVPEKTGIILGRGGYLTPGMARLDQYVRTAEQLVTSLRQLVPGLDAATLARVKDEFRREVGAVRPDTAIGLVPNLAASRIANRLDLGGPAYTVDAACSSALLAVDQARAELTRGRCDLVIAGGVHLCHDVTLWSVFSQLGALSRGGKIRPFDRGADGLLIGEGVGLVVLERLDDAVARGHRIYAVIRGSGVASDGRGASVMSPQVAGQVLALQRAWGEAGIDPREVGLVEAHGTATPAGDAAELETLRQVFGDGEPRAVLGSVKSMIGHTMPAAGAAGLIKAALAIHHRVLPPTLHCDQPHPLLAQTRFRTLAAAEPWDDDARRAGVNAFGFGGIDAHLVLEAPPAETPRRRRTAAHPPLSIWAAADTPALLARLDAGEPCGGDGPCRLAVLDPTPERLAKARRIVDRGNPWRGRSDIWFAPQGLLGHGARVAFLFPGIEAAFDPEVDDVAAHFGLPFDPWQGQTELEQHGGRLIAVGRLLDTALRRLGVEPDVIAGHSIGEWNGMIAAALLAPEQVDAFIAGLAPGQLEVPDVVFAALGCGAERAREIIGEIADVTVSHDNCPHQSIVCGPEAAITEVMARVRAAKVLGRVLPFRSGFHSPSFSAYLDLPREKTRELALQPAQLPLWSATTCAPYPADDDAVRALVIDHLTRSVRFREVIEALYADGVRAFVQVGTGSLVSFVEDTLGDRPHVAVSAHVAKKGGLGGLRRAAAQLHVEGARVKLDALPGELRARTPMRLSLGAPLVRTGAPLPATTPTAAPVLPEASPAILAELTANLQAIADTQRDVVAAWTRQEARLAPRASTVRHTLSVDAHPYLLDHCFYRQPAGWPDAADRYPVVPMTMHLELMVDAARSLVPERVPVAIEDVRAWRWCAVAPPAEVDVSATFDGGERVTVRVGSYAEGTVILGDGYPAAPAPSREPLQGERPPPVDARAFYDDRWMFHGPAYQGVTRLDAVADDGIRGALVERPAPGALVDNAGQLMGFWVMQRFEVDRLAFPVRIDRLSFYGPTPAAGDGFDCRVWIRSTSDTEVRADLQLTGPGGALWCDIRNWVDHRFDTDEVIWPLLRFPEENLMGEPDPAGYVRAIQRWRGAASRELIARRYLDRRERAEWEAVGARRKADWLVGRIAVKDAVRHWLQARGGGPIFPIEVAVHSREGRAPRVDAPGGHDLRVSLAHKDRIAVALVAEGRDPGIDLERIEPRSDSFADIAFTPAERTLGAEADRDEWMTRVWAAKEAAAKARGTGLQGNPRRFEVVDVAGERMLVSTPGGARTWIQTRRDGDHVVAWTVTDVCPTP